MAGDVAEQFGRFDELANPPIYIVTAFDGQERSGCLIGFGGQTSIEPLRFTAWISKVNHTFGVAERSEVLAVHLVPTDAYEVARLFAEESGDWTDKFARCEWDEGPGGTPLLRACPDRFVGRVVDRFDGGDHVAHLLEPLEVHRGERSFPPTVHFNDVRHLPAGHPTP